MGVTGKKVERAEIGGRARTMAGAAPTDLHYVVQGITSGVLVSYLALIQYL